MNVLFELQKDFAGYIRYGQNVPATKVFANGIDPERRLAIYRNNTVLSLTEALRGVYPGLQRLVGDEFFRHLCRAFIADRPPTSACLIDYGRDLGDFLSIWPKVVELPYLSQVVHLEWLEHEIYHEATETVVTPADLGAIPADRYGDLRFRMNSTVRLLESRYPLDKIRRLNRDESISGEWIDLDERGCRLLLCRPEWEVELLNLDEARYQFFARLQAGSTLLEAAEVAISMDSQFDLSASLQLAFDKSLLAFFTLD